MTFSILFWNIWLYNQLDGEAGTGHLLGELKRLVDRHKPDYIGLNEVVQSNQGESPFVLEFLRRECGYAYNHFAHPARFNDDWLVAAAFASRSKIHSAQNIVISKNDFAAKRGYPGFNKEAISVEVALPEKERKIKIIVAHPLALIDAPTAHYIGVKKLNQLLHSKEYSGNTILLGDMNEWRLIPGAFRARVADVMHSRTGSVLHPTWRYNAHRFTPLRANLDYVYWSKHSDFSLKTFRVLASQVSDHRPLLATFELAQ